MQWVKLVKKLYIWKIRCRKSPMFDIEYIFLNFVQNQ